MVDLPSVPLTVIGVAPEPGVGPPTTGTIIQTPANQPNYVLNVVGPVVAVVVRFVNVYATTLVGLIGAAMTPAGGKLLYTSDFLHLLYTCASLALPGALFGLLKDIVTIFGRLEGKFPLLTGSV